eukprot:3776790-Alexandrium_andersonii.AAC.1
MVALLSGKRGDVEGVGFGSRLGHASPLISCCAPLATPWSRLQALSQPDTSPMAPAWSGSARRAYVTHARGSASSAATWDR